MNGTKIDYDPATFKQLTFSNSVPAFNEGKDSPSAYLDRCLATIEAREPAVQAWTVMRTIEARKEADASTKRYREGRPLSSIDGMPIGIKDLILTKDMPTALGIAGNDKAHGDADSASVQALRDAGAIVLGKLVTTELGDAHPGPTNNPFDLTRTPGGSSSGSAAAVGAGMVPAALGSQVGGSIIRPASFCANFATKPTFGAINRGERQGYSQSCLGVHAGSLHDMWRVSAEIVKRVGGDPGHPGLFGPIEPPAASKPMRLIVMESAGWAITDNKTLSAFETILDQLRAQGVQILIRGDHPFIEEFERSIADTVEFVATILRFENKSNLENLIRRFPTQLSAFTLSKIEKGRKISLNEYREALGRRQYAQSQLARLAPLCDALISLSSPGPAPSKNPGPNDDPRLTPIPTGTSIFNIPTSMLWTPAVTVPLMSINRLPVGIQLIGQLHDDYRMTAYAQWLFENLTPVSA